MIVNIHNPIPILQQRAALAHEIVAESNLDPATAYLISSSAAAARNANFDERSAAESVLSESLKLVQGAAIDHSLELPHGPEYLHMIQRR